MKDNTFNECIYDSQNISETDKYGNVLSKLLGSQFQNIDACAEEVKNMGEPSQNGYTELLFGLMKPQTNQFSSSVYESPSVYEKQVLANKHMINMSAELERRNFGSVSETTKELQAKYSQPVFEVKFPDINLLGISEDATDVTQFSMKIINLSVIALIAYMFLRLILK